jgi:hypothetical protein
MSPSRDPFVENSIQQMEVQALNFGYRFIRDARVRRGSINGRASRPLILADGHQAAGTYLHQQA